MIEPRTWTLKALTDIWTGDRNGKPDRVITTGLLGSIRWWCEVIVRGLGGSACDPSNPKSRCPDIDGRRCVVCELFGCTGWARKFRFDVLDADGRTKTTQIKKNEKFILRFTELRPISAAEWVLLELTIRLIADYGAIGGKTVYKPSDEKGREREAHHRDYGIVRIEQAPNIAPVDLEKLRSYIGDRRWRGVEGDGFAWASLERFWSVSGRYLARQGANQSTFNRVIGRPEPKGLASQGDSWLAGLRARTGQQPESKKVFSVKEPPRTFGFTNGNDFSLDSIKEKLRSAWPDKDTELKTGDVILNQLLRGRVE